MPLLYAFTFLLNDVPVMWALHSAYIGPGAGFAFAGTLMIVAVTFALALSTMLLWPFTFTWKMIRVGNPFKRARFKRVVVLGLDGMDPVLTTRFIQEGRLPNFEKLAKLGVFRPLDTSHPSMSPVAWSTFATGADASHHSIYDFLTRDPCTYQPMLSSTDIRSASKVMNIGPYVVPLEKPKIKLLRKSQTFWKILGKNHIFSSIQRVPITFPPEPFKGVLLSGMCVPDLRGTQGTFSFFSTATNEDGRAAFTGGEQTILRRKGKVIRSRIVGPDNSMLQKPRRMTLPFTLTVEEEKDAATLEIDGEKPLSLKTRELSPWIQLTFSAGLGIKVRGIARFYLMSVGPEVNLYMTPIHIDPENPAMPISHPAVYSVYLAKKLGPFATLGLAEDTWALNERVIDEQAFIDYTHSIFEERERMFHDALKHTRKGFVTTVFDTTDRIQHMFYRYLDPTHPANEGRDTEAFAGVIADTYVKMDELLGRVWHEVTRSDTLFMVISDHGFTNFRRGVNLNTWLRNEGYLALKEGESTSGDWFESVDWKKTRAFSLGLTGIFINRKGREKDGIVEEGEEYRSLVQELKEKLERLTDPQTSTTCIRRVQIAAQFFEGPYRFDAPDLLVGYEGGFRNSWECATGAVTEQVFTDNTKSWSGDHCVDPEIVPGIFLCNQRITEEKPKLVDIPLSILRIFGIEPPRYMQGQFIFGTQPKDAQVHGLPDPDTLEQSGRAPLGRTLQKADHSERKDAS